MRHVIIEEPYSDSALWSRRLALFALAVIVTGLALSHLGLDPSAVLAVLGSAIMLACLAILCAGAAAIAIWRTGRKGIGLLLTGGFIATILLSYPLYLAYQAVRLPALSDVSTDVDDPPEFSLSRHALMMRKGFVPTTASAAEREKQIAAYPDVEPIILDLDGEDAYQTVLHAITARHWKLVEAHPPGGGRFGIGHVDAIDHSRVLGFANDITIRIRPLAGQTRIDVRSVSRVGRHDFGSNARRIMTFADELKAEANQK